MSVICLLVAEERRIIVAGREWLFEMPSVPMGGPMVCGKRGEVLATQPGSRSPFWRAIYFWEKQGQRIDEGGLCVWEDEPPRRVKVKHVGRRNQVMLSDDAMDYDEIVLIDDYGQQ